VVSPNPSPEALPACARGQLTIDLAALPMPGATAESTGGEACQPAYRLLSAPECQCRATEAAVLANQLDGERQVLAARQASGHRLSTRRTVAETDTQSSILLYAALEDRNRSAGKALGAYYQLGAAEANRDIVRQALAVTDRALSQARDLKKQGLAVAVDDTQLYRQQLDLRAQSVKLELQIEKLNSDLRLALGLTPPGPAWRFWPQDALRLITEPVHRDEAIAVGLAHRPELQLLTELEDGLSSGNAPAVLQALQAVNALLGKGKPPLLCPKLQQLGAILCGPGDEAELQVRRQQLHELHAQKEHELIEQIGQAVHAIHAQVEVIVLVRQQIESWQAKIREAEDKEQKGVGSFAETAAARTEWLQAKRRAVEEIANLQRAWVQLRQTQGMLVAGCQPGVPDCHTCSGLGNGRDRPAWPHHLEVAREQGAGTPSPAVAELRWRAWIAPPIVRPDNQRVVNTEPGTLDHPAAQ
jgi:hypothetical protein